MSTARYVCGVCLTLERSVPGLDLALCADCGEPMVEVTAEVEAQAGAWATTQPGVGWAPAAEGASNTFHSVSI